MKKKIIAYIWKILFSIKNYNNNDNVVIIILIIIIVIIIIIIELCVIFSLVQKKRNS